MKKIEKYKKRDFKYWNKWSTFGLL